MAKKKYKIHPAIGIARLGDSDDFFIGPENPDYGYSQPSPPFKKAGKIRPQAARFRVFEYVEKGGNYHFKREIDLKTKDVQRLVWKVHLANRKASFFEFDGLKGAKSVTPRVPGIPPRRNGANTKPKRDKLEIDPKERRISGLGKTPVEIKKSANPKNQKWPVTNPQIESLGRLGTDSDGNLLVIGGRGVTGKKTGAAPIGDYANNDGWFDDVADGPVKVYLKFKGQKAVIVEPSWVITAPPDFAPHIGNVVTLYDVLFDLAARNPKITIPKEEGYLHGETKSLMTIRKEFKKNGKPELKTYKPSYDVDIFPILNATLNSAFVYGPAASSHTSIGMNWKKLAFPNAADKGNRNLLFGFLRAPTTPHTSTSPNMPKLLGDEPYPNSRVHPRVRVTVTETQYAMLKQWRDGKFVPCSDASGIPAMKAGPVFNTPYTIDRAALMNCVGAAMYPGIEASWQIREPSIFSEPFRIKHNAPSPYPNDRPGMVRAGHFTRQMALPWQADFLMCRMENGVRPFIGKWGWWPAQRPDEVFVSVADYNKAPKKNAEWTRSTDSVGKTLEWAPGRKQPNYDEMLANWKKFGFITEDPKTPRVYVETERETKIP